MIRYCNPKGMVHMVPLGIEGKGEIQTAGRKIWNNMLNAFTDLSNIVNSIFSNLDGHVCAEMLISGTQSKDMAEIRIKATTVRSRMHSFLKFGKMGESKSWLPIGTMQPSASN